jgi:hypothetical protein
MGLFENIGRKVEKFKQEAQSVSEDQAVGKCRDCGEFLYTDRPDCPDCGSEDILRPEGVEESDSAENATESDAHGDDETVDTGDDETVDTGDDETVDTGDDADETVPLDDADGTADADETADADGTADADESEADDAEDDGQDEDGAATSEDAA